jgi:hypothetical protein
MSELKTAWYYRFNPCDMDRHPKLAPLGDFFAKLAVECPCCNGMRIIGAAILGLLIGAFAL